MTNPRRPDQRLTSGSPGQKRGPGPATATQAPAHGAAKPLSPALDKTFKVGLVLKGLDGVLEVAGGILLLFLSPRAIEHVVRVLTAHELSEDPHDLVARYLLHTASHLNHGTTPPSTHSNAPSATITLTRLIAITPPLLGHHTWRAPGIILRPLGVAQCP